MPEFKASRRQDRGEEGQGKADGTEGEGKQGGQSQASLDPALKLGMDGQTGQGGLT
jgi:hypothetical protein